jgi:hypothetical protein
LVDVLFYSMVGCPSCKARQRITCFSTREVMSSFLTS